jgi:mitochondrial fission protein ELM1
MDLASAERTSQVGHERTNDARPLAGRKGWIITDEKIGMYVQVKGVADALGLDVDWKKVAPTGLWRMTAPWGPSDPRDRFGEAGSLFAPPWPAVALATGRLSIPYIRALRRKAGIGTYTVVLQDPKTSAKTADLIWVPEHDRRRGPNVITTLTAPHSFSPERLTGLQTSIPPTIAALPTPRLAVILGGPNSVYKFTADDCARFERTLTPLAQQAGSLLVTASRRTPPALLAAATRACEGRPHWIWDGTGENPYPAFLAHADAFVVTGDSVNMTGEPCATGRPVYVFEPAGGSGKFTRFHESLRRYGATRRLDETVNSLRLWSNRPLDSARVIAAEIEKRWQRRNQMLTGGAQTQ